MKIACCLTYQSCRKQKGVSLCSYTLCIMLWWKMWKKNYWCIKTVSITLLCV